MNETSNEYESLIRREVASLERELRCRVRHLGRAFCPRCGESGRFDLKGLGFILGGGNSIYYSTVFNEWRCRVCDYRMCA